MKWLKGEFNNLEDLCLDEKDFLKKFSSLELNTF